MVDTTIVRWPKLTRPPALPGPSRAVRQVSSARYPADLLGYPKRRQRDRQLRDVGPSKALISGGAHGLLLMGGRSNRSSHALTVASGAAGVELRVFACLLTM